MYQLAVQYLSAPASLVIAEGTFLLSQQGNWPQVLPLLDQSWFVHLEDESGHERLIRRHNKQGMVP